MISCLALSILLTVAQPGALLAECTESEALAADISGEITPPASLVTEISSDLSAIRQFDPRMENVRARVDWVPGHIYVMVTEEAANQYKSGIYDGLDSLNQIYGPVETYYAEGGMTYLLELVFSSCLNSVALSREYELSRGVLTVHPREAGPSSTDVIPEGNHQYTFILGWGDCPAGCISKHYWVYSVLDGVVTLLDEYGDQLPVKRTTWGLIKARVQ